MKVCSECQRCYDDSFANCSFEDRGILAEARSGNCTLIKGYEINSQIESDSPVELFRATHLDSKKSVLIKIIKADNLSAELRNELQSYVNINHPSLARIFEFGGIGQGEVYIVSEDLVGQNIRENLNEFSNFKELKAISIARQIANGLVKLHDAGLIHRHINPANIYLIENKNGYYAKLNYPDFCGIIAKNVVKDANGINAKTEIFEYYSPEQFSDKEINFKSDLYSLAIVLYEMLLGRTPYELLSSQAIAEFIFNENDVDHLHHDLRALIAYSLRESLHQHLEIRPSSTDKMVRQLRHLELVATPSDFVFKEEKSSDEPKWMGNRADREKVIEDLKRSPAMLRSESVETTSLKKEEYEKTILSDLEDESDEIYALENEEIIFDDNLESNLQTDEKPLPISPIISDMPPNSYTFKKSHVYIAGVLVTLLLSSLFVMNFYNWTSDAASTKVGLKRDQTSEKNSENPVEKETDEISDSQTNENIEKENDVLFDVASRENIKRDRAKPSINLTPKDSPISNAPTKIQENSINERETNKQTVVEETPQKQLFEDTIITVGDNQKNKKYQRKSNSNNGGKNGRKIFSDIVITY